MKVLAAVVLLSIALASSNSPNTDAPTGFDNKSNGMVDDAAHQADQAKFDDINRSRRSWTALQRLVLPGVPPEPNVRRNQPNRGIARGPSRVRPSFS